MKQRLFQIDFVKSQQSHEKMVDIFSHRTLDELGDVAGEQKQDESSFEDQSKFSAISRRINNNCKEFMNPKDSHSFMEQFDLQPNQQNSLCDISQKRGWKVKFENTFDQPTDHAKARNLSLIISKSSQQFSIPLENNKFQNEENLLNLEGTQKHTNLEIDKKENEKRRNSCCELVKLNNSDAVFNLKNHQTSNEEAQSFTLNNTLNNVNQAKQQTKQCSSEIEFVPPQKKSNCKTPTSGGLQSSFNQHTPLTSKSLKINLQQNEEENDTETNQPILNQEGDQTLKFNKSQIHNLSCQDESFSICSESKRAINLKDKESSATHLNSINFQQKLGVISPRQKKQRQLMLNRSQQNMNARESKKNGIHISKNFFSVALKMRNYASKMASQVESKKLALLERQKFEFLRDKSLYLERRSNLLNLNNSDSQGLSARSLTLQKLNKIPQLAKIFLRSIQQSTILTSFFQILDRLPLFFPLSRWRLVWELVHFCAVLVFFFYIPLYIIFDVTFCNVFSFHFSDLLFATLLSLDIIFNFNTKQFDKGTLISTRPKIFFHYLKNGGVLAVIHSISTWVLVSAQRNSKDHQLLGDTICTIIIIISLFKVLSLNRIHQQITDRLYLKSSPRGILRLSQILFNLFIVTHLFATVWLIIGKQEMNNDSNQSRNLTTISSTTSWMKGIKNLDSLSFIEEYLVAYYFATVTMITVGYGDFTPVNSKEYLLSILTMLIACGMFGYSLNAIGQILAEMNANQKAFRDHFYAINGFMHKKSVPRDLQFQVREYLQYFFIKSNAEEGILQSKTIQLLPDHLQNQLVFEANKVAIEMAPLFKQNFSKELVAEAVKLIQQKELRPGDFVFNANQEDDSAIYFIEKGTVQIFAKNKKESIKIFKKGQCFGQIGFFTGSQRILNACCQDFSTLLFIKRIKFIELLKSFPHDFEKFSMIKDEIQLQSKYDSSGSFCLCCKSTSHLLNECNFVHLITNKYKVKFQLNMVIQVYEKKSIQIRDKNHVRKNIHFNTLDNQIAVEEISAVFLEDKIDYLQKEEWFNELVKQEMQDVFLFRTGSKFGTSFRTMIQQSPLIQESKVKNIPISGKHNGSLNNLGFGVESESLDLQEQSPYLPSAFNPGPHLNFNYQKHTNNLGALLSKQKQPNSYFKILSLINEEQQKDKIDINEIPSKLKQRSNSLQFQVAEEDIQSPLYLNKINQIISQYQHPLIQKEKTPKNLETSIQTPTSFQNHIEKSSFSNPNYLNNNDSPRNYNQSINSILAISPIVTTSPNKQKDQNNFFQMNQQASQHLISGETKNYSQQQQSQIFKGIQKQQSYQKSLSNLPIEQYSSPNMTHSLEQGIKTLRGGKKKVTLKNDVFHYLSKQKPNSSKLIQIAHVDQPLDQQVNYVPNQQQYLQIQQQQLAQQQFQQQQSFLAMQNNNEQLFKQLQELMAVPKQKKQNDDSLFETLKNFSVYLPHNNSERVIIQLQQLQINKKKQLASTKMKRDNKILRMSTHKKKSSSRTKITLEASQKYIRTQPALQNTSSNLIQNNE